MLPISKIGSASGCEIQAVFCTVCKEEIPLWRAQQNKGMCKFCEQKMFHQPAQCWLEKQRERQEAKDFDMKKYLDKWDRKYKKSKWKSRRKRTSYGAE